uniref:Uncharacterized protein n=1 Tax=Bos mutus grunniens TaxID=30521 RepID=A0A8C0A4H3_BOSMU
SGPRMGTRVYDAGASRRLPGPARGLGVTVALYPQYYCCKKDESEEDEEEPDFAVHSRLPRCTPTEPGAEQRAALCPAAAFSQRSPQARALCRSCSRSEPPAFFLQEPEDEGVSNGGERVAYRSISQEDVGPPPGGFGGLQALNPNRLSAMREAFSRSRSVSTDV